MGFPKRKRKEKKTNKEIYIFCEGTETEVHYFNALKQHLQVPTVKVKVKGVGQSSKSLLDYAVSSTKNAKEIENIWIVFDMDHLKLEDIEKTMRLAKQKNIDIAFSNCSFEVWLLLHFEKINVNSVYDKKVIYRKLENYLDITKYEEHKSNMLLIQKIADNYNFAISNNDSLLTSGAKYNKTPYSNVVNLVRSLKKK